MGTPHAGNLKNLAVVHGRRRLDHLDPPTQPLQAAGATPAEPYTFRTLITNCKMERPLVGRDFQVWALPNRVTQKSGQHNWRFGA